MSLRWPNGFISANYDPLKTPNAPTIGTATATGPTSASVTFTAPSSVGGGAITSYIATAKKTSDGTTVSGTGSSSPVTISGLTTNEAYTVTVAAVNAYGSGPSSAASNSITPIEQQLWSWGFNSSGQLGTNSVVYRSSPVQVGTGANWSSVATSYHTASIKTDGTLWSWGFDGYGQLGQGAVISRSSPVQVGALTTWYQAAVATNFTLAIKTDGTLWAWGRNYRGQLGLGNTTNYSSPKQVGALTNWSKIAVSAALEPVVYAFSGFAAAVKTDGTLWAWGYNGKGQLGINNTNNYNSPKQVGALTTWQDVSCGGRTCLALKTDGTLWSWGFNDRGQLGLGNTVASSSPVQIGALTTWSKISTGYKHSLAINTSGALWSWGYNNNGQLGQGDTGNYKSSPTQVGALTTWSKVAASKASSFSIKTDGTLWAWGNGQNGRLGFNNTANYSSPKQVGALTTWSTLAVMATSPSTLAIKG
jgi:alpha-tubulin suppressor-like RCC1 family protein